MHLTFEVAQPRLRCLPESIDMRRLLSIILAAVILSGMIAVEPAAAAHVKASDANFSRAPYLQCSSSTNIWIVFRTTHRIHPILRFGQEFANLHQTASASDILLKVSLGTNRTEIQKFTIRYPDAIRWPKLHSAPAGTFQYEVQIKGLRPETHYYYAIYDGQTRLTPADPTYQFTTHPPIGSNHPMRFWVVGDGGVGRENQALVHRAMLNFTQREKHPIDFYIHVGDMAYMRGRDVEFQSRFFEMYEPTLRHKVCWPSLGNHEGGTSKGTNGVGPYFDAYVCPTRGEAGGLPSGLEAYYAFDYGRVHFICLDSHDLDRKPTGAMARWLKADMERTKADWIVAFFHHPPYTKGSHDSDKEKQLIEMRTHLMPILESGGVDVVLTGHSHIYERSMLIDGAYATPTIAENCIVDAGDGDPGVDGPYRKSAGLHPNEGDVQIVAGHGGIALRRRGTCPIMKKIIVEHGSCIIDVNSDTLTGIMLNKLGEERDRFSIVKRGSISPLHIPLPWQAPAWAPLKKADGETPSEIPEDFVTAINTNAVWQYLTGSHPEGKWSEVGYKATGWKSGEAGFGYNNKTNHTNLSDMKGKYATAYFRHEFEVEHADQITELGLLINYDDAFIAYLNGKEVLRKGVGKGSGKTATNISKHGAGQYVYLPIGEPEKNIKDGKNCLAIEGHNTSVDSLGFTIDPILLIED